MTGKPLVDLLLVLGGVALAWSLAARLLVCATVFEYERGLLYRGGRFAGILPPGRHWHSPLLSTVVRCDLRSEQAAVTGQEVLSADGVALKFSLALAYRVDRPDVAHHAAANYRAALHAEAQAALRHVVGSVPVDELLAKRGELSTRLHDLVLPKAAALGLALEACALRDLTLPGPMKAMFAQSVAARKEAEAALERARGETAALRHLLNASKLLKENPALLQLRALQALGQGANGSLVVNFSPDGLVLRKAGDAANLPPDPTPAADFAI